MLLKSSHADSIFSKCCVYSRLSEVMQLAASASRGKTGLGGLETTSWLGKLAHPLSRSGLLGACLKFLTFASVGLFESGSFLLHFRLVRRRLASIVMGPRLPCVFARAHCVFHLSVFGCEMIRQIATARFPAKAGLSLNTCLLARQTSHRRRSLCTAVRVLFPTKRVVPQWLLFAEQKGKSARFFDRRWLLALSYLNWLVSRAKSLTSRAWSACKHQ